MSYYYVELTMVVFVILCVPPLGQGYYALTHRFFTMYLTLVIFHVFQHLWLLTWRILGVFAQRYLILIRICRVVVSISYELSCYSSNLHPSQDEPVRIVASEVALWRNRLRGEAHGNGGSFHCVRLHWSIEDRANCAGLYETIYLSSFRLGPFFCVGLEWLIPIYF